LRPFDSKGFSRKLSSSEAVLGRAFQSAMGSCESFFFGPEPDEVNGANGPIRKGMRVQTQWTIAEGGDGRWYMGTIKRLYNGNKCKINYDD
ncbi:unnamed protein product, partial [Symbiodinium necroappetens]